MMEAGTGHTGGRTRRVWPPVRRYRGRSCTPGRARLLFLAGVVGLMPVTAVGNGSARAAVGCQAAPRGALRAAEGMPKDSGESSGFAASQRYPGVIWMIRDSGHPADLYALRFNADGVGTSRVMPVAGADNRDWEEVTRFDRPDGTSGLWIVESGQSGSNRTIYEVPEPDPDNDAAARATARYSYEYPDRRSNTEAAFTYDNKLILVSKSFPGPHLPFRQAAVDRRRQRPHPGGRTDRFPGRLGGQAVARPPLAGHRHPRHDVPVQESGLRLAGGLPRPRTVPRHGFRPGGQRRIR